MDPRLRNHVVLFVVSARANHLVQTNVTRAYYRIQICHD